VQSLRLRNTSNRPVTWVVASLSSASLRRPRDASGDKEITALPYAPFSFERQSGSLAPSAFTW
jgi:hypothetical protein